MMEVWKDIENYEGIYQVSNYGRVRSLSRTIICGGYPRKLKGRILNDNIDAHGYTYYFLYKDGISKRFKGHRLVAKAFIENPHNYNFINHKDENKRNNKATNLEWCNPTYNLNYGTRSQKYMKPIVMINPKNGEVIRKFNSLKQAESELNISHSKISNVCYGKRKTAGGYGWMFEGSTVNDPP